MYFSLKNGKMGNFDWQMTIYEFLDLRTPKRFWNAPCSVSSCAVFGVSLPVTWWLVPSQWCSVLPLLLRAIWVRDMPGGKTKHDTAHSRYFAVICTKIRCSIARPWEGDIGYFFVISKLYQWAILLSHGAINWFNADLSRKRSSASNVLPVGCVFVCH